MPGRTQGRRIAPSRGSQMRSATLSAMKKTIVAIGGQRDSPICASIASPRSATTASTSPATRRSIAQAIATLDARVPRGHDAPMTEPASATVRRLELVSTVLLALATVATAWAAYQSRQWTGEQAQATSHATATRIEENRVSALANRQVQIDVATFIQWLDARQEHRPALARFYQDRFRAEFKPAFTSWLARRPFTDRTAPPTPFAMPQYRLKASADATALERSAAADSQRSKEANRKADNYMLAVVLLASALFFAGMSTKLLDPSARMILFGLGCVVFL